MYGMNENQNVFVDGARTTSRVTQQPGGRSSVQLGWDAPAATAPKANAPKDVQKDKEKENLAQVQVVGSATATAPRPRDAPRRVSSNVYARGSSQNVGNVITDRPTSKVTQPPGGRSSICFH